MRLRAMAYLLAGILLSGFTVFGAERGWPAADPAAVAKWRSLRFGMFIHWGPVSLTGKEIGWSRGAGTPVEVYDNLYKVFNPTNFNADEWVDIAKAAGMKYIVLTTKHHDGFCLWDTKFTDYNIMNSPFHRDVVKELAAACKKQGIEFGAYYSVPDWYDPNWPTTSPAGKVKREKSDLDAYEKYLQNQTTELIKNYGPLITLWNDMPAPYGWRGSNTINLARKLQSDILINDRTGDGGDYATPEQRIGGFDLDRPWESCMTVSAHNHWAWGGAKDGVKSTAACLEMIIGGAGGDGNILLNVGPRPDGMIDPEQAGRLKDVGAWLAKNGESIYGTRGGPWKPTESIVSTRQGNVVYLHVMRSSDGRVELPALPAEVKSASLLNGRKVAVTQKGDKLVLEISPSSLEPVDTVVKLELDRPALSIPAIPLAAPAVHVVVDLGHQFSFYGDGRFHQQYLAKHAGATSWGSLFNYDFANANLLVLLGCDSHLSYVPQDIKAVTDFLAAGGGVVLLGSAGDKPQNELAKNFGCEFEARASKPLKAVAVPLAGEIEGGGDALKLHATNLWEVLIADAAGKPVLVRKRVGKGTLLVGARGLAGSNPNAKDNINAAWWSPLLASAAAGKAVDPKKPFDSRGLGHLDHVEQLGRLTLHYSDYLKPYAKDMMAIYQRSVPVMEKRIGVPLSEGMASEIGLLATGGGGFSAGRMIGLAVFWGDFPAREDGMIEFITHESTHSWVLPFPEVWNEPIATYVGDLVMCDMGYKEEGLRRIKSCIERASRIDPTMKLYDISGNSPTGAPKLEGGKANDMHWGKTFWVFEQLRQEDPEIVAHYFQAKRKLAKPGAIERYDINATVAVLSVAIKRDLFPWFKEHGFDVDRTKSPIPVKF